MDNQDNEISKDTNDLQNTLTKGLETENGERVFLDEKYTPGSFLKSCLLGAGIGLAVIVPGISGAAIAILLKMYDKLIYAVAHIFTDFKKSIKFLFPIIIGALIAFVVGFFLVKYLLELVPFAVIGYFAGLMIGALPTVMVELKGDKISPFKSIMFGLGVLIPVAVGILSVYFSKDSLSLAYGITTGAEEEASSIQTAIDKFGDFAWSEYVIALPIGFVMGITQIIPGLSATAFLMMFGYYRPIVASVSLTYWSSYPQIFGVYAMLAVGFILGLVVTSAVMDKLFAWNRRACYRVIVGLSVGSIIGMFVNPDIFGVYASWAVGFDIEQGTMMIIDIALFVPLIVLGFLTSFLLIRFSSKKQQAK